MSDKSDKCIWEYLKLGFKYKTGCGSMLDLSRLPVESYSENCLMCGKEIEEKS